MARGCPRPAGSAARGRGTEELPRRSPPAQLLAAQLGAGPPVAEDQHPVHQLEVLVDLGRQHDDGQPGGGQLAQQRVDVALGADVDAAGGVVEQQHRRVAGERAGDDHLLLVAAGQRGDRVGVAAEPDLEPVDVAREPGGGVAGGDQPAARIGGQRRGREVLPDRQRREDRLLAPVPGDVGDPRRRAGGRARPQRPQVLVLALALEAGEADDLPGPQRRPPASSTTAPGGAAAAAAASGWTRCSPPVISSTSRPIRASPRSRVATDSPDRSTVTRSAISVTSSIRCEMNSTAPPALVSARTAANSRSRVATSSAEVASSRISTLGSRSSAGRSRPPAARSARASRRARQQRVAGSPPSRSARTARACRAASPPACPPGAAGRRCRARGCRTRTGRARTALPGTRWPPRRRSPPAGRARAAVAARCAPARRPLGAPRTRSSPGWTCPSRSLP